MKPACEIDEYASIRLTFRWTSAARLPTASETHGDAPRRDRPEVRLLGNAVTSTRSMRTSAAVFVAADMNAVTGVGAPS